MNFLHIDFETRSECDLIKTNAWIYSEHESTEIICMGYKLNDDPVKIWTPGEGPVEIWSPKGGKLINIFLDVDFIIAHNALFEHAIISNVGVKKYGFPKDLTDYKKYICTAGMARSAGLPGSLAKAGAALGIKHQKLDMGKKLIQRYCKPKKNKTTGELYFIPLEGQDRVDMLEYCRVDVMAEDEIYEALKDLPNNKLEREIFSLDFKQNTEGLKINMGGVREVVDFLDKENRGIQEKIESDYPGLNVKSNKQFKEVLINIFNANIENTQEKTLVELYDKTTNENLKTLIDARLFLAKASVKKFKAMKDLTSPDNRTRHFIGYYIAGTGRFAGRGFQPHNLPKSKLKESVSYNELGTVKQSEVIEHIKKLLPTMIIPDKGHKFLLGDFAAIEARGLAYLADEKEMLKAYKNNEDLYVKMAAKIYHKSEDKITKQDRALGKAAILGSGYGLGKDRFFDICKLWGMDVSHSLAEESIQTYRDTYSQVPKYWRDLESAFKQVVLRPGVVKVGLITIEKIKNYIAVTLPNGRILYYHKIRLKGSQLEYWNHSRGFYVKLWGGIITENIVQAVARDILTDRMLLTDSYNLKPILHVHDEIICQVRNEDSEEGLISFNEIMNTAPEWLPGFPLVTESEIADTYYK